MAGTSEVPAPRVIDSVAELRELLGEELGPSAPEVISQERIDQFAAVTGDDQWIHVDVERARRSPAGGTIAHGYLVQSLIPRWSTQLYVFGFGRSRVNYGSNRVRFLAPVPAGSVLRATARFLAVDERPGGVAVTTQFTITTDGAARPACVAEVITFVASA